MTTEPKGPYSCGLDSEGLSGPVFRLFGPGMEDLKMDFVNPRGAGIIEDVVNRAFSAGKSSRESAVEMLSHVQKKLIDSNAKYIDALRSISLNTCCHCCGEAKRVALQALGDKPKDNTRTTLGA